ncbi:MAG: hypothetical protein N3A59_09280, partial [Thermodesulfovibrionales bacterium]|nr:hypothetical protein [Thermodesulfovibrionales bacterium]
LLEFLFSNNSQTVKHSGGLNLTVEKNLYSLEVTENTTASIDAQYGILFGDGSNNTLPNYLTSANNQMDRAKTSPDDFNLYKAYKASDILYTNTSLISLTTGKIRIARSLINDTAAQDTIYVTEVGLFSVYNKNSLQKRHILLARDILTNVSNPIAIPYGHILTVEYIFEANTNNSYTNNFIALLSSLLNGGTGVISFVNTTGVSEGVSYIPLVADT